MSRTGDRLAQAWKALLTLLRGKLYYRYSIALMMGGVALIAGDSVAKLLIEAVLRSLGLIEPQDPLGPVAAWLPIGVGVCMIVSSLLVFAHYFRRENREAEEEVSAELEKAKRKLATAVRALADAFRPDESRPPAYKSNEATEARELARRLLDTAPSDDPLVSNLMLRKLSEAALDASSRNPFFDITPEDLEGLAGALDE